MQYLVIGDDKFINWGVFLAGHFPWCVHHRLRAADAATSMRSCAGGILMGFGVTTAGGCSIGNGLVMTALLTWQGWVGLAFMILGVWTASWYLFVRPPRRAALQAAAGLVIDFDRTQATESLPQWAAEQGYLVTDYQQAGAAQWSITLKKA